MMKYDEQRTLPNISVPVLVVMGEHDRLTLQSASQHIAKLLPNATSFCDHGGHLGYWEHSQIVNDAILEFATKIFEDSFRKLDEPLLSRETVPRLQ